MENASQALIIGFSMLIFVIALTICITMFSQARATSDFVIFKSRFLGSGAEVRG